MGRAVVDFCRIAKQEKNKNKNIFFKDMLLKIFLKAYKVVIKAKNSAADSIINVLLQNIYKGLEKSKQKKTKENSFFKLNKRTI